MTSRALQDLLL